MIFRCPIDWPCKQIKMTSVSVLFDGFSIQNDEVMTANCSCTLIKTKNCAIVVDTMTAWDKDKILNELNKHETPPENINFLVCTHSHADHIGNNNLFLNAEHIVGLSSNIGDKFFERNIKNEPYVLCDGVKVMATPGHTNEDVSVLVDVFDDNKQKICYAVVGDLFEKKEDITDPTIWQNLGTPELKKIQAEMRWKILNMANYIIPGHGPKFQVTDTMKEVMKNQLLKEGISINIK